MAGGLGQLVVYGAQYMYLCGHRRSYDLRKGFPPYKQLYDLYDKILFIYDNVNYPYSFRLNIDDVNYEIKA